MTEHESKEPVTVKIVGKDLNQKILDKLVDAQCRVVDKMLSYSAETEIDD